MKYIILVLIILSQTGCLDEAWDPIDTHNHKSDIWPKSAWLKCWSKDVVIFDEGIIKWYFWRDLTEVTTVLGKKVSIRDAACILSLRRDHNEID